MTKYKMETYCRGCTTSHQDLKNTWSKKGSLQPGDYDPFEEGYCCGGNHATMISSWTRAGNVTPDNSPGHGNAVIRKPEMKEKFCCNIHNAYARMDGTWSKQKPYSS